MHLDDLPRIDLAHLPTPLEHLTALSSLLGGPSIFVKRDDATGLATGGNKTRKLEFLIGEAIEREADTVITTGAMQSNHARQTAAAAGRAGLRCVLLLENRHPIADSTYEVGGNVLLDRILGAEIIELAEGTDLFEAMDICEHQLRESGAEPYLIPIGGSNAVGALGYVDCAIELVEQSESLGVRIDHVVHATASAGTQAGLVAGFAGLESGIPVTGVSAGMPADDLSAFVFDVAVKTAEIIGAPGSVTREMVVVDDGHVGPGYGLPTTEMLDAVELVARTEGLLLDPVYTGKAMAGLMAMIRDGRFDPDDNVVFVHTGGIAGLMAYGSVFDRPPSPS